MTLPHVSQGDPHAPAHNAERDAINDLKDGLDRKISLPTGAQTGDLLRWDGTAWLTTETRLFEGHGDPNGHFAAPIGSRYVDMDATNGVVEWIKTGGAETNAGWTVAGAGLATKYTGRRDISGLIAKTAGSNVYNAHVQRYGNVVDMFLDVKMPTAAQDPWTLFSALPGFGPGYDRYGALTDNKEAASNGNRVDADGGVFLYATVSGKRDRYAGTWITNDPWPTGSQLPPAV